MHQPNLNYPANIKCSIAYKTPQQQQAKIRTMVSTTSKIEIFLQKVSFLFRLMLNNFELVKISNPLVYTKQSLCSYFAPLNLPPSSPHTQKPEQKGKCKVPKRITHALQGSLGLICFLHGSSNEDLPTVCLALVKHVKLMIRDACTCHTM